MELNGCLQRGHSALFLDHSRMQQKQNMCRQWSRQAKLSNMSRQIEHLESGDTSADIALQDFPLVTEVPWYKRFEKEFHVVGI